MKNYERDGRIFESGFEKKVFGSVPIRSVRYVPVPVCVCVCVCVGEFSSVTFYRRFKQLGVRYTIYGPVPLGTGAAN